MLLSGYLDDFPSMDEGDTVMVPSRTMGLRDSDFYICRLVYKSLWSD